MQMLAETMAACFKKGNEGCFTCGDKNHLKRDCPKKANKKTSKNLPRLLQGNALGQSISLNLIFKENHFQETPSRGLARSPSTKPGTKSIFSRKSSTSGSAVVDIPALNDFLLYPQSVPSRIPTGLLGPLPPQTFGLLLGRSSLTSKGTTVHPGIIDSDYKGTIQIMMSSKILQQFKRGDKIAQLLLLPDISIDSSNDIRTGRFGSTDKKQSLWTSLVTEYA